MGFSLTASEDDWASTPETPYPLLAKGISGHRYYQPEIGRWLNRDPIQERGGANLFAFCANHPINAVDLRGEGLLEAAVLTVIVTAASAVIVAGGLQLQKLARHVAAEKIVSDKIKEDEKCHGIIQGGATLEMSQNVLDVVTQGYSLESYKVVVQYYCSQDKKNVTILVWGSALAKENGGTNVLTSPWSIVDEWTSSCPACNCCK